MSPDRLREYSRKELEHLARRHGVPNVRQLRKQDLIDALVTPKTPRHTRRGAQSSGNLSLPNSNSDRFRSGQRMAKNLPKSSEPVADHDALHVEVVDGVWLRISWQVADASRDRAAAALGAEWHTAVPVLQLADITPEDDQSSAAVPSEHALQPGTPVWYVRVADADATYRIALGYRSQSGRFHLMLRSRPLIPSRQRTNVVNTTVANPSSESTARMRVAVKGDAALTNGNHAPLGGLRTRFSSSYDTAALRIPQPTVGVPPLEVELELVVHGVTDRESELTLMSKPLTVGPDGRFEHHIPLAPGRQVVPIVSTAADGSSERTVVVALDLSTRELEPRVFDDAW